MADYDTAIDLDPDNFLAHYNRGLLRMQLGDDNRAITDFDYVVRMEPSNVLAVFNRAILLERTGDLRAAIRDYSNVIRQFPNFWTGLSRRAACYRKLGMTAKAELDEFRIFKAQMNKRLGIQPRWNSAKRKQMRRRSEIDPDKYNQIVVADDNTPEHEYKSDYRGRVQNRATGLDPMPMFALSYVQHHSDVHTYNAFAQCVETYNVQHGGQRIYITCTRQRLNQEQSRSMLVRIDSLTRAVEQSTLATTLQSLLLQRAVAACTAQDYDAAVTDLDVLVESDTTSVLALWQRSYCIFMQAGFGSSVLKTSAADVALLMGRALTDVSVALRHDPENQYLYYNRACLRQASKNYALAIDDYTRAIAIDSHLAEAYYNRGLARITIGSKTEGIADLSKAGELGLYKAYSVIKHINIK